MESANLQQALEAARNFQAGKADLELCEIGAGNINDTFVVTAPGQPAFILQRLSRQAFHAPEQICENLQTLNRQLPTAAVDSLVVDRRWAIPHLLASRQGRQWWCDANHDFWRALSYIDNTITLSSLKSTEEAMEVGRALAIFHTLVSKIEPDSLHVTIPHFHETPYYFGLYEEAVKANPASLNTLLAEECRHIIHEHQDFLPILEEARSRGELKTTTIHGDPKLANILFDRTTSQACAFIDLDTVGPGLLLYDLGDCLRSCCNPGGATYDLDSTRFDSDVCLAIIKGYLEKGPHLLRSNDRKYLLAAIRLIPLELGLRFFTDYLTGCHYFKTTGPEQTLQRAAAQFRLASSIKEQHHLLEEKLSPLLSHH